MALSFAGVALPIPHPTLIRYLKEYHPPGLLKEWNGWNFQGTQLQYLPTPPLPVAPEFELGVLHWPRGAVNPAWFHFVVPADALDAIRAAVGSPLSVQPLILSDGRVGKTVTASMYMLPPRPLSQFGTPHPVYQDAWVVTLTDRRFFWQWNRGAIDDVGWPGIIDMAAGVLGVSVAVDTIDPAYTTGGSSKKWVSEWQPAATVLDAGAAAVGQKVVVSLLGAVATVNWETAKTASDNYALNSDPVFSGGFFEDEDVGRYVPERVTVVFKDKDQWVPGLVPPTTILGPSPTLASLMIPEYGDATGDPATVAVVFADPVATGSNVLVLEAVTLAAAEDWYGWRLQNVDLVYPGVEPWIPTGWEECVEWVYQLKDCTPDSIMNPDHDGSTPVPPPEGIPFASTRVRRGEFSDFTSGGVWPSDVPVGWPAEITSSYDGGYAWKRLKLSGGAFVDEDDTTYAPLTGAALFEVQDNQLITAGARVLMWPATGSGDYPAYQFQLPPPGCNLLMVDGKSSYKVDVGSLAGDGLTAVASGDCEKLEVNAGYLPGDVTLFGCGLVFDGVSTLSVDFTDVVTDPLVWTGCELDLNIGCHLTIDGETGALVVNVASLADDPSFTSLRVLTTDTCDVLGVDLLHASQETYPVMFDACVELYGGKIRLKMRKYPITNYYNAAGLLIDQAIGEETVSYCGAIDVCNLVTCCAADPLVFTGSASPTSGAATLHVTFTINTLSGGVAPYTLVIDWGDGSDEETFTGVSAGNTFTHDYTTPGTWFLNATVTDACGQEVSTTPIMVSVSGSGTPTCAFAEAGSLSLSVSSTIPCLNGFTKPLTTSMAGTWYEDNSGAPCSSDTGFVTVCTGDTWTGVYNGCALTLVYTSPTTLTFQSTGDCLGSVGSGVSNFVVTITP